MRKAGTKSAAVASDDKANRGPYVDQHRDQRDCLLASAINGAIQLMADGDIEEAADILRLAEYRLTRDWPFTEKKFWTEVRP